MSALKDQRERKPGGAPPKNTNALKNGKKSYRLVIGEMPDTMRRQQINALRYRRALESEVQLAKGEISLADAHAIDVCTAGEVHSSVCRWLLKTRLKEMTVADVLACSREILRAKETRLKAFGTLKLGKAEADTLASLYDLGPDEPLSIAVDEPDDDDVDDESSPDPNATDATPECPPQETES